MLVSLRDRLRQLTIFSAVAGMVIFNVYVRELPLYTAIPQKINSQFIPAPYTAFIWYTVYIGMVAYAIYQFLPRQTRNGLHYQLAFWLILACIAQIIWRYLWDLGIYQWSLCALFVLLEAVMVMYKRLAIGRIHVRRNETLFVRIPISLWLGWLVITTLIYSNLFLASIGWDRFGLTAELWTVLAIGITALISGVVAQRHRDFVFALATIWGFIGIAAVNRGSLPIILTVIVLSAVMMLVILATPADLRPNRL